MASKRKQKQRYKVNVEMQAWDLAKAGAAITLKVQHQNRRLGVIEIGQGSLRWKAVHAKKFTRIAWNRLADKLNEL